MDFNTKNIEEYNQEQLEHIQLVQKLVFAFCNDLMERAIDHDTSKFSGKEYWTFVESKEALSKSQNGKDKDYQKYLTSDAIQHHYQNNKHHPEYWDSLKEEMPIYEAIIMFFDWYARSLQKKESFDNFWEYNLEKLSNQSEAKNLVEYMKKFLVDLL